MIELGFSRITLAAYRVLAPVVERSRMLNRRLGDHTVAEILSKLPRYFLRPSPITSPVVVDGHHIYHTGQPSSVSIASGLHEPKTAMLVRGLLRPGMTLVDVGAHLGWYTILAARAVGEKGHVYAFEPEPSNFELLLKNVSVNGYEDRVTLVRKAVCDAPRRVSIFTSREDSAYSSMFATPGVGGDRVEVEATCLDQFFSERGWPSVDVVKVDIEGAEQTALRGMVELSRRNPKLKLIIEYLPLLLEAAGETPQRLFDALEELGFMRRSIISWRLIPVEGPEDIGRRAPAVNWHGNLFCEK